MTPKEKAFFLLSEMNNAQVTLESFKKASYYGQQELKRKCLFVISEILKYQPYDIYTIEQCDNVHKYWQQVKTEIENL
jgi:hypothetical protein